MRHKDTVAVTVTLPRALHEAAKVLAQKRECSNVSAVVRTSLYKEVGIAPPEMEIKEGDLAQIDAARARTVKYSRKKKNGKNGKEGKNEE